MLNNAAFLLAKDDKALSETSSFHKETVEDAQAFIREMTRTVDKNTVIKEKEAAEQLKKVEKKKRADQKKS